MNNDLISRSALIAKLEKLVARSKDHKIQRGLDDGLHYYMPLILKDLPTVDAVEVCRCKDCKWGVRHSFYISYKCTRDAEYDEDLGGYVGFIKWQNADDFCSHGERRNDNDTFGIHGKDAE